MKCSIKVYSMKNSKFYSGSGLLLGLMIIALSFGSCKISKKDSEGQDIQESGTDVKDEISKEVSDFVYPLPQSSEVTEMLNRIGIAYMLGTSNTVENVNRYFTAKSKAYNIGVYGTDLSYASTYQMTQETMLYLEAINQLGGDLGISSIYNEDLLNSIDRNIDDKDSLVEIITITINETYDFLNKNGKGDLSILMVAGGWIEAMYLTTNVSANVYNNPEIVKIIYLQKASLNKLLDIIESRKENPDIQELLEDFQPIKEAYDAVNSADMEAEQVQNIASSVETLRNTIIF